MDGEEHYRNEDEVDLAELVGVLFRRWKSIVYVTILVFIVGCSYSYLKYMQHSKSGKYKFESVVKLGQSVSTQGKYLFIEKPQTVEDYLTSYANIILKKSQKYFDKNSLNFSLGNNFNVNVNEDSGIVNIILEAPKNSKAKLFIDKMINELLERHNNIYQSFNEKHKEFSSLNVSSDNYLVNLSKTVIMLKPTISDTPVSSPSINYKLYLSISLILGLFLGVFTAFLREFWVINREKILDKSDK